MEEQKQFCVEINREGGETVWSSDWREGADNSIEVPDTCALEACTQYRWRLKVLGQNGGADSAEAAFSTGKRGTPWKGIWITGAECTKPDEVKQAVYVRRAFCASKPRRAVLYIAGLGYFQASINGRRVGDDYLSTAYTAYDKGCFTVHMM